ncbi:hypothetical protein HGI30_16000 [Paenibacillus albicereus]|uniref:Uncharacterized protein n=1 Tax=Paenibacillus albicereus TaxID=2726185 RepID=A0A6H2GZQ4_9BACL|nr:hypothetical protein [Paenibacillus albicereus]QJC52921.1 hypothetical protein HGI30_16000 [Paenibacillus albicereus]
MLNKWHSYEAAKRLFMATGIEPLPQDVQRELPGIEPEALVDGLIEYYKIQGGAWHVSADVQGAAAGAAVRNGGGGGGRAGEELALLPRPDLEAGSVERRNRAGEAFLRVLDDLETKAEHMRELGAAMAAACYDYAAEQLRTALADA